VRAKNIDITKYFKGRRVILPVLIGLVVTLIIVFWNFDESDTKAYKHINWTIYSTIWIGISILMMVFRDLGYMIRLRILSDNELSWRQAFEISMLWEFSSAISPSAIGGTAVALVIMAQEKIKTGKTTAIVLITSLLDEVFFIVMVPVIFILIGFENAFPLLGGNSSVNQLVSTGNLKFFFWTGYIILFTWTILLIFALILKPNFTKRLLLGIFSLKLLKRWRWSAREWAKDLENAALSFKGKGKQFWAKAFGATFLSWTARYLMVNSLMLAFGPVSDHLMVYGRQLVMWVILLVAVTPGGSGVAEIIFPAFLGEFLPQKEIAAGVAFVWRFLSYYPYIIIGSIVFPIWLRRIRKIKSEQSGHSEQIENN
jgi:uncharacterized protein (TIRG00374 family)